MTTELTAEAVEAILLDCLYTDEEIIPAEPEIIQGIVNNYTFHPERLASHRDEIGALLLELPDGFQTGKGGGGGWSFLNACMDRHDNQWTGLHRTQEHLLVLGIATKQARFLFPRDFWASLPGNVPYFAVTAVAK